MNYPTLYDIEKLKASRLQDDGPLAYCHGWNDAIKQVQELNTPSAEPQAPGPDFLPKVGETWFVRMPGAVALSRFEVSAVGAVTVTLWGDGCRDITYKQSDLEFVEKWKYSK
jgi:hypothetical protein